MPIHIDQCEGVETLAAMLAQAPPYLVVSPPRSCSTAFARSLGQHSQIGTYFHEPCGRYSYDKTGHQSIVKALQGMKPGDLIKEMTFQLNDLPTAMCFLRHTRKPPVFLVRDPHLTLESRIRMVLGDIASEEGTHERQKERIAEAVEARDYAQMGDILTEDVFPLWRTGWSHLGSQLTACRREGVPFVVVEASRFREDTEGVLTNLCEYWGLPFESGMLSWKSREQAPDGALARHNAWYARVAASTGVQPPTQREILPEHFPQRFREHLPEALEIYRSALGHEQVA